MSASSSGSFAKRRLDVTFQLGGYNDAQGKPIPNPTFVESNGANTVTLSGLRCSASIVHAGGVSQGACDLRVYGMTESLMNQLSGSFKGVPLVLRFNNLVTIAAGTDASGLSIAYQGTVSSAWADYDAAPDVAFHVLGLAAMEAALKSVPPSSYKGGADVAVIMSNLAGLMSLQFENNGVSGIILSNPYFPGTAYQQMEACRDAAGIEAHVIDGTLAIWPRGGSRGSSVPLISPGTGMKGYPRMTSTGIEFETLYNPAISFGAKVQVQSSRQTACGIWTVQELNHTLESETPDGAWFSRAVCLPAALTGKS